MEGSLVWTRDRFEVTKTRSGFYGGKLAIDFSMKPLGDPARPGIARLETAYEDVDVAGLMEARAFAGLRLDGRATGRNLLTWPLGRFREHTGDGEIRVAAATALQDRTLPAASPRRAREAELPPAFTVAAARHQRQGLPDHAAPPAAELPARVHDADRRRHPLHLRSGVGDVRAGLDRDAVDLRRAAGPDRVGRSIGAGLPRDQRRLAGERPVAHRRDDGVRQPGPAGAGRRRRALRRHDARRVPPPPRRGPLRRRADARLGRRVGRRGGRPRDREQLRRHRRRPHHARRLDDGRRRPLQPRLPAQGSRRGAERARPHDGAAGRRSQARLRARRLPGRRRALGRVPHLRAATAARSASAACRSTPARPTARPSTPRRRRCASRARASASTRSTCASRRGSVTGAAFVGWDGTYSFNADGRRVPVESLAVARFPSLPLTGLLDFSATGSGTFDEPRYSVRGRVVDLFAGEEGLGQLTGRVEVRGDELSIAQLEGASPRLAVSGGGRITLSPMRDADLTLRFSRTSIDPYVRLLEPRLSPFTTVVASGGFRVVGPLRDSARLSAQGSIEDVDLRAVRLPPEERRSDRPVAEGRRRPHREAPRGRRRHDAGARRRRPPHRGPPARPRARRRQPEPAAGLLPRHPLVGVGQGAGRDHRPDARRR